MIPDSLLFGNLRYVPDATPERPDLWVLTVGQDYDPPCPAVVVLKDDPHAIFTREWQFFTRAANHGMTLQEVSHLFGNDKWAFNKGNGFPYRHNWLTGEGADLPDPQTDKVRDCLLNAVAATQVGDHVYIQTFDSREPPPLKPGRTQPRTVEEITIDDYLYTPQTHPWMFVVANIINERGDVVPFPGGALYPWTEDNTPYSFLPLVFNHGYGNVYYPTSKLRKLAPDEPIPSPYRRT